MNYVKGEILYRIGYLEGFIRNGRYIKVIDTYHEDSDGNVCTVLFLEGESKGNRVQWTNTEMKRFYKRFEYVPIK